MRACVPASIEHVRTGVEEAVDGVIVGPGCKRTLETSTIASYLRYSTEFCQKVSEMKTQELAVDRSHERPAIVINIWTFVTNSYRSTQLLLLQELFLSSTYSSVEAWSIRVFRIKNTIRTLHGGDIRALDVVLEFLDLLLEFVGGNQFILCS